MPASQVRVLLRLRPTGTPYPGVRCEFSLSAHLQFGTLHCVKASTLSAITPSFRRLLAPQFTRSQFTGSHMVAWDFGLPSQSRLCAYPSKLKHALTSATVTRSSVVINVMLSNNKVWPC